MFTVSDLFKDVYKRPPGHEESNRARKCEKRVLKSVIRQTDFHNKQVEEEEMWASRKKEEDLDERRGPVKKGPTGRKGYDTRGENGDARHSSRKRRGNQPKTIYIRKKPRKNGGEQDADASLKFKKRAVKIDWEAERRKNERLREQAWMERSASDPRSALLRKVDIERNIDAGASGEKEAKQKITKECIDNDSTSDVATNSSQPKGRKHVKKSPKREKRKKKKEKKRKEKKKEKRRKREKKKKRRKEESDHNDDRTEVEGRGNISTEQKADVIYSNHNNVPGAQFQKRDTNVPIDVNVSAAADGNGGGDGSSLSNCVLAALKEDESEAED
eukprot:jgi/Bigna1/83598/fgenesh1_pg.111_\